MLARHKKHAKRTLKQLLMFCKLGFPLLGVQLDFWDKKHSKPHNIMTIEDGRGFIL
jgi:hypothetical protein